MAEILINMKEITKENLKKFLETQNEVQIGKTKLTIGVEKRIKEFQPQNFELERTNVWSFPKRGKWATHKSDFRGNWPPQLVRNIILRYSKPNELVLDQMCGSGTTLIECKLLSRRGIGVDINPNCVMLTRDRLNFDYNPLDADFIKTKVQTFVGDARNLNLLQDDSIDLIATHPPYANVVAYSSRKRKVQGDLSFARTLEGYLNGVKEISKESFRVLNPGRFCCILVGDTRRSRHHVPIAFRVMETFLDAGFVLREDVIKVQWKTKITREKWAGLSKVAEDCWVKNSSKPTKKWYTDFFLLSHEHLFIFRKPKEDENLTKLSSSIN